MIKKYLSYAVLIFCAFGMSVIVLADSPKLPPEIGVRIRNVQLDQSRLQNEILRLTSQYQGDQQALQHDQTELDSIKKEALTGAKLDGTWDVDLEKLEFVGKPKAAQPEVKK